MANRVSVIPIEIKISGMGGIIATEVYFIAEILKGEGYEVEIVDDHPPENEGFNPLENLHADAKKVTIIAKHIPWGG